MNAQKRGTKGAELRITTREIVAVKALPEEDPSELEDKNFRGTVLALVIISVMCALGLAIDFWVER